MILLRCRLVARRFDLVAAAGGQPVDALIVLRFVFVHPKLRFGDKRRQLDRLRVAPDAADRHMTGCVLDDLCEQLRFFLKKLLRDVDADRDKFIAAQTIEPAVAEGFVHQLAAIQNQLIACRMPHIVIGSFEPGNVGVHDAHRATVFLLCDKFAVRVAIEKSGQIVVIADIYHTMSDISALDQRADVSARLRQGACHIVKILDPRKFVRRRIVHADKADQLFVEPKRNGDQIADLLRLQHHIGVRRACAIFFNVLQHDRLARFQHIPPVADRLQAFVLKKLLLRRHAEPAMLVGVADPIRCGKFKEVGAIAVQLRAQVFHDLLDRLLRISDKHLFQQLLLQPVHFVSLLYHAVTPLIFALRFIPFPKSFPNAFSNSSRPHPKIVRSAGCRQSPCRKFFAAPSAPCPYP